MRQSGIGSGWRRATGSFTVFSLALAALLVVLMPRGYAEGANGARLPEGWRIASTGAGNQLVWTSPKPVPMGDARVEFRLGDRLLGVPRPTADGRTFRLPLADMPLGDGQDLRVVAAGLRLDSAGKSQPSSSGLGAVPKQLEAALPPNEVDPGEPGTYRTATGEYDLKSVKLPGLPEPVEMRAVVVGPVDAPDKRPLAFFLHGRHAACYGGGDRDPGYWPCKPGTKPVPSYRGHLDTQKLLASQG